MKYFILGGLMAFAMPTLLFAQEAPTAAPDPARLVLAKRVVDQVLPPAQREAMIEQMIRPMMTNINQAMASSPQFNELQKTNPRFETVMREFMAQEQDRALNNLRQSLPALSDAMAKAYARRFDIGQLNDLSAFFETATGRAYIQQSMTIMSDPDIASVQRDMMIQSMDGLQGRVAELVEKLAENAGGAKP